LSTAGPLLEIENLKVIFHDDRGRTTHAVDCVDLTVRRGQTLGLVGESGCGKSVTALAIMGLLPKGPAEVSGRIRFDRTDLLGLSDREMCDLRGDRLAMIFQEPMTSLNPVYSIGEQIAESLVRHRGLSRKKARARTIDLLRLVKIPSPEQRVDDYPHRLSGGMRQRAMIALALACDPKLLIADEPTTALDVTIQAQILDLMRDLKAATDAAIILITHDLGVVAEVCDEVAVMYAGEIVERAPVDVLFAAPQHPTRSVSSAPFRGSIGASTSSPPSTAWCRTWLRSRGDAASLRAVHLCARFARTLHRRSCRLVPATHRAASARRLSRFCHERAAARGRGRRPPIRRSPLGFRPSDRNRDRRGWGELFARGRQNTGARGRIRLR